MLEVVIRKIWRDRDADVTLVIHGREEFGGASILYMVLLVT
jgi:hypothetical protein